jgi:hypothetical protein
MADLDEVQKMKLWAWVGLDDGPSRSGEVGLKQALVPAGYIPMVACKQEKMTQDYIQVQMQAQADHSGVKRYLVRFTFEAVEYETQG